MIYKKTGKFIIIAGIIFSFAVLLIVLGYIANYSNVVELWPQTTPTPSVQSKPQTADLSPKVSPAAEWKTYSNAEYGFEFRYPQNVAYKSGVKDINFDITKEVPYCAPEDIIDSSQDKKECRMQTLFSAVLSLDLVINVKEKPADLNNLESYLNNIVAEEQQGSESAAAPFSVSLEKIKIGGQDSFSIVSSSMVATELKDIEIYTEKNNYLFIVQYNYSNYYINSKNKGYDPDQKLKFDKIQEIISTFKFTK